MKKIVSLLLAGAMLMSFATVGSAATGIDTPVVKGTIGDGWIVSNGNMTDANIASFQLSDDNAYSLPYSMKLTHSSAGVDGKTIGITIPATLTANSQYKIRFKSTEPIRNTTTNSYIYFGQGLGWTSGCKQYSSTKNATITQLGDSGWYQNEFYYTVKTSSLILSLNTVAGTFEDRYFDDFEISLVTTDDAGNEVLTPVEIKDPSFDATAQTVEPEETEASNEEVVTFGGNWKTDIVTSGNKVVDVTVSADEKTDGKYSAHMVYEGSNVGNTWAKLSVDNLLDGTTNALSDKYTIKFKIKGTTGQFFVGFGAAWGKTVKLHSYLSGSSTNENVKIEDVEDGWKEVTLVRDSNDNKSLLFHADKNTDVYIDDVSVYNETDQAEVTVPNSSFEAFALDKKYDINSPVANGGKNQITISWYNPASIALNDIEILENGTEIAESTSAEWTLTKGAHNKITITGLTAGDEHTYTIRAYKSASEYTDYVVSAKVANGRYSYPVSLTDGKYAEDWAIQYSNGADGIASSAQTGLYLDERIKYSGDYALRAEINEQTADNTYVQLSKSFPTEIGKTYRLSYMGKGAGVGVNTACLFFDTSLASTSWKGTKFTKGTSEWTQYSRDYTATAETSTVYFMLQGANRSKSIWIDDVMVQEVLEDGTLGANVLNGGSFEKEITNLTETDGILSWNKDNLYYDYVNIYEKKTDGSLEKVNASETITGTSYLLKDAFEEEKTYVVKTVLVKNSAEVESSGVEITVNGKYSITEDEEFEQVTFETDFSSIGEGAQVIKKLDKIENGNIMASITIANKNGNWSLPVKYFVALYDGEQLVDIAVMEKTIGWRGTETLSAVVNVADVNAGDYTIRTFLWDENLTPLKAAGELFE